MRGLAWTLVAALLACTTDAPSASVVVRAGPVVLARQNAPCREPDETASTTQTRRDLRIDAHEVTRDLFEKLMGYDPSFGPDCPRCPVESVTLHEAMAYCAARASAEGRRACYTCDGEGAATRCRPAVGAPTNCDDRLPTEVEWLRVARATGAAVRVERCMGREPQLDPLAWYKVNAGGHPHPVGTREGSGSDGGTVYDLWGNVYEWTAPWGEPGAWARAKGGSWYHNAHHARPGHALEVPTTRRLSYVGFRCVQDVRDAG